MWIAKRLLLVGSGLGLLSIDDYLYTGAYRTLAASLSGRLSTTIMPRPAAEFNTDYGLTSCPVFVKYIY
jgi:hypothetical protein